MNTFLLVALALNIGLSLTASRDEYIQKAANQYKKLQEAEKLAAEMRHKHSFCSASIIHIVRNGMLGLGPVKNEDFCNMLITKQFCEDHRLCASHDTDGPELCKRTEYCSRHLFCENEAESFVDKVEVRCARNKILPTIFGVITRVEQGPMSVAQAKKIIQEEADKCYEKHGV